MCHRHFNVAQILYIQFLINSLLCILKLFIYSRKCWLLFPAEIIIVFRVVATKFSKLSSEILLLIDNVSFFVAHLQKRYMYLIVSAEKLNLYEKIVRDNL